MISKINTNRIRYWIKTNENQVVAVGFIIIAIISGLILTLKLGIFESRESLTAFIESQGALAPLVMIILHILQVILPAIPGTALFAVSVALFGPVKGFFVNYIGHIIGAIIAFWLTRDSGKKILRLLMKRETYQQYLHYTQQWKRFEKFFIAAIVLPGMPDELLCYLAGLSSIPFSRFLIIMLLGKPFNILPYSLAATAIMQFLKF